MLDIALEHLKRGDNLFITGGAGVGKTTLVKAIIAHYHEEAKRVAKLASTGMAATLIGGQTLHSFFDLGVSSSLEELQKNGKIDCSKKVKKLIQSMDLIIIDEISMVCANLFELIRLRLLQADCKAPLIVVGDFLQLPPATKGFNDIFFAFEAPSWERFNFKTIHLKKIYRTEDRAFIEVLHGVRFGQIDAKIYHYLHHLIKPLPPSLLNYTFLFGKNDSASRHNKEQLEKLEGEEHLFVADVIRHNANSKPEQIERFFNDARIERELKLKIGAPILFTRNSWNYFNGQRGIVIKIDAPYIYIKKSDDQIVKIEKIATTKTVWREKRIDGKSQMVEVEEFSLFQYPIKLAFGITIHKSQGMSIYNLVIETKEIFAPSQFYVALSRAITPKSLILLEPLVNWDRLAYVHPKAKAFVKSFR